MAGRVPWPRRRPAARAPALALLLGLVLAGCGGEPGRGAAVDPAAVTLNNRGVALMGRFEYARAAAVFRQLVTRAPDLAEARLNLAVAVLNRQQPGDEEAALGLAAEVLDADPGNLRAHYLSGLLRLYQGDAAGAADHFRVVAEGAPRDAYAAYYLGQCLAQEGRHGEALPWLRRAIALDPYLRSAYYGAFQAAQRLGERDAARELVAAYRRLARNPASRLAEFKYTRMGPLAEARTFGDPPTSPAERPAAPRPAGAVLAPPRVVASLPAGAAPRGISAARLAPGEPLLLLVPGAEGSRLLHPDGTPAAAQPAFLEQVRVRAALWGDVDNDGRTDLVLARDGPTQLWRQQGDGEWVEEAAAAGIGDADQALGGALFDADHDGDLDLYLLRDGRPDRFYRNNLDGTFSPLPAPGSGGGEGSRSIVVSDLDGDRDADLLVFRARPPHALSVNHRLQEYRAAGEGLAALRQAPVLAALAADLDADGQPEIYTVAPGGALTAWSPGADGRWQDRDLGRAPLGGGDWAQLATLDLHGDGRRVVLAAGAGGWVVVDAHGRVRARHDAATPLAALLPVIAEPGAGPSLVAADGAGNLVLHPRSGGPGDFLTLELGGRQEAGGATRSNASGVGARTALRVGRRWTVVEGYARHSGPGWSLQPLALGLGGAERADFVAIDWSDGVYQTELDLAAGAHHRVVETQRQLSSCPVLFAWDGERIAFVSDFLGVGGIGYAVGPGEYATPRPRENLLLPPGLPAPRDGRLVIKIAEPMEEIAYLDALGLAAWDLPPGWRMALDERLATGAPEPTGAPLFYRREWLPVRARNDRGADVTARVRTADGTAAPVGPHDHRFIGRLAADHVLTLELDDAPDPGAGGLALVVDGWVEYPYSQTMVAAAQAGAAYRSPTLEVRDAAGRWEVLLPEFGYPAGMPRRMAVPLPELPAGATALRLRTNMEIYWDRVAVVRTEPLPEATRTPARLLGARLAKVGFPRWTSGPQRRPHYDYADRSPFWDTRYMEGAYTRLGPVTELVAQADDALVVLGPGEEVHLDLLAPAPAPAGWTRRYVLEARGWAKDMDLHTRDGATVGPLPAAGHPPGPREALHARTLTRFLAGP